MLCLVINGSRVDDLRFSTGLSLLPSPGVIPLKFSTGT